MTDISTEPVVGTHTPPVPPAPAPVAVEQPVQETRPVAHTPGGWPVVPLATTGANSTIGAVAATALATGPAGAVLAVAGAALVGGAVLARRATRNRTAKTTSRAGAKIPTPRRTPRPTTTTAANSPAPYRRSTTPKRGGTTPSRTSKGHTGTAGGASSPVTPKSSKNRMGQVKALRQAARTAPKNGTTRAERRAADVQNRRAIADTRRGTAPARLSSPNPPRTPGTGTGTGRKNSPSGPSSSGTSGGISWKGSPAGRSGSGTSGGSGRKGGGSKSSGSRGSSWLGGKVRAGRDTAVERVRKARDRSAAQAVENGREQVRAGLKAKQARAAKKGVRKDARRQLWRSAARKQGRRLLAAALAAPLGVVGLVSTPLGRKLGITSIQQPGRRLYRRMLRTADEQKAARDAEIREGLAEAETAIDAELSDEQEEIGGTVQRPTALNRPTNTTTPTGSSSSFLEVDMSGFKFEVAAAEMESAARSYAPDTAMEILAMVEGLPAALASVANTFRILAERSDTEFPLEKDIAGGFDEIYGALMRSVDAAGDLAPLFRHVHAQDIARHEDPRNGHEAEKGWNV
ncbi:hypothetical protein GCM10010230_35150 [Streptomyces narbonensis]|uniref:hypothetical protein n=1 Tax=Streptomyces narbonensis TaxID=67333 RepID=UPI0019B3F25F|nr:hypothetical protein [Streptomyces narbonensis]GGW02337.1 hypothetical protein GCM10010230_35150 [Streptomyces narbonensis]